MTEAMIEQNVTRKTDALDARYMKNGQMSEAEYKEKLAAIDRWAEGMYRLATPDRG